jgi:hypothetical protein
MVATSLGIQKNSTTSQYETAMISTSTTWSHEHEETDFDMLQIK